MSSLVRKLQSGEVLSNYPALLNLANTALRQVNEKQLVLSESLTNPQRMVQIAMAVADVPFKDIVFVQYPTVYAPGGGRVLPVSSAADVLFTALSENKPIRVTGAASGGGGVEVVGEAGPDGTPTPTKTPDANAPTPTQTPVGPARRPRVRATVRSTSPARSPDSRPTRRPARSRSADRRFGRAPGNRYACGCIRAVRGRMPGDVA